MLRTHARPVPHLRLARRSKPINRRKPNILRRVLGAAVLVLIAECVAVALLSPRFQVKTTKVSGLKSIPLARIRAQFRVSKGQNLFLAPTGDWEESIARLPAVASVSIAKHLPGSLEVLVQERKPWASVRTKDGRWHTIDKNFIPFRVTASPEAGLLRILASDFEAWEAIPGIALPSAGLEAAQECADWISDYGKFPVTQIEIDAGSKVCLNRVGGVPVYLGSSEKTREKLTALEKLLAERPDLALKDSKSLHYINLFAADAPAIAEVLLATEKKP
ncbi:MAG: FtsQ-type POTRA domain-containing protein [Armatimonadetes bacterium]|nr:FtsQ-type POTRA domain-containing protein [Armatimonadota bacterium]